MTWGRTRSIFPFLVLVLLMPVSTFAQSTGADDNTVQENPHIPNGDVGPVGNVDSSYLKILKQSPDFQNLDIDQQRTYIAKFVESRENLTAYQHEVNLGLENLSSAILNLQDAEVMGENTTEATKAVYAAIFDLELLGVVSQDRLEQNKEYWSDRVSEAIKRLEGANQTQVSYSTTEGDIHKVHTDDVSLKNQAEVFYPCFASFRLPIPLYCVSQDISWGGGTTSYAQVSFVPYSFPLSEHLGKICLHRSVAHSSVVFSFDVKFEQKNVNGDLKWSHSKDYNGSISGSSGGVCAYDSKIHAVAAGDSLSTKVKLDHNITVRGSHA